MFFVFSKSLSALTDPLFVFFLLLLALGWWGQGRGKKLCLWAALVLYLFSLPFLAHGLLAKIEDLSPADPLPPQPAWVIVLTGMLELDKAQTGLEFNSGVDRLFALVDLAHQGKVQGVLLSGGSGALWEEDPPEALLLKSFLQKKFSWTLPLLVEPDSRNTWQNAALSKQLLQAQGIKPPLVLVTSAFHGYRARLAFSHQGLPVLLYKTDYRANRRWGWSSFLPSGQGLLTMNLAWHELTGIVVYRLRAFFDDLPNPRL